MKQLALWLLRPLVTVWGAFSLAFALLHLLPDPAVIALGLYAGNTTAITNLQVAGRPSYLEALAGVATFNFGQSLDQVPVRELLGNAIHASLPRIVIAGALILGTCVLVIRFANSHGYAHHITRIVASLPPYVPIVLVVTVVLGTSGSLENDLILGLALATSPLALVASVLFGHLRHEFGADHTRTYLAQGASGADVRRRTLWSATLVVLPILHVVAVNLFTSLIFVEALTSASGLGSLTLRAARRVDTNLLLGLVVLYAFVAAGIDASARVVRSGSSG